MPNPERFTDSIFPIQATNTQRRCGDEAEYNEESTWPSPASASPRRTTTSSIVHYLRRKLRDEPLPTGTGLVIGCRDAYAEHPKKLVTKLGEGSNGAWYLFSPRDTGDGEGEGHWKAVEAEVLGGAEHERNSFRWARETIFISIYVECKYILLQQTHCNLLLRSN
ncbi:uncharacterized protein LOC120708445 [Panicum virgatum]|uniref:uncharacterized protein LOC120708445 n=1 Tax=Panicum virgatum TaxID=38727 RepID=UPI0019D61650|nr:uncharacterized protein LOC120708445 [Panicum virgatum]